MTQGGGGLIVTPKDSVQPGGTIEVQVTNGAAELEVSTFDATGGTPTATRYPVPKDGKVTIAVPANAKVGSVVTISTADEPYTGAAVEVVSGIGK